MRWERIDFSRVTHRPQLGANPGAPGAKVKACVFWLPYLWGWPRVTGDPRGLSGQLVHCRVSWWWKRRCVLQRNNPPDVMPSLIVKSWGQRGECEEDNVHCKLRATRGWSLPLSPAPYKGLGAWYVFTVCTNLSKKRICLQIIYQVKWVWRERQISYAESKKKKKGTNELTKQK